MINGGIELDCTGICIVILKYLLPNKRLCHCYSTNVNSDGECIFGESIGKIEYFKAL